MIPLARTLGDALKSGDDLTALRQVSDERAAEVARLASDRDRLLSEVLHAEGRERARLAESLHDGPMQRLMAMRQDMAEAGDVGRSARRGDRRDPRDHLVVPSGDGPRARVRGVAPCRRGAVPGRASDRAHRPQRRRRPRARRLGAVAGRPGAGRQRRQTRRRRPRSTSRSTADEGTIVVEVNDDGVGIDTVRSGPGGPGGPRRPRDGPPAGRGRRRACSRSPPAATAARAHASSCQCARNRSYNKPNGPGVNRRGHSLDVCSITSCRTRPKLQSVREATLHHRGGRRGNGGEGGSSWVSSTRVCSPTKQFETSAYQALVLVKPLIGRPR